MGTAKLSAPQTRAQAETFMRRCSFAGLRTRLPLRWPRPPGVPDSPKKKYRSFYVYQGYNGLEDPETWKTLSLVDLVLRLVDFGALRHVLAWLLGWTSAQGQVPFDPVSIFLLISWQIVNGWQRSQVLRNIQDSRYADYAARFGFRDGDFPTEGGIRHFLTALGLNSDAHGESVSVALDKERTTEIALQRLNHLLAGAVALLRDADLISPQAWQSALVCPDGQIHHAASRMRCASVQATCYQRPASEAPRSCLAKEKGQRGCACDTLACMPVCQHAPTRDPEARCVYYSGSNQSLARSPNAAADPNRTDARKGKLYYGYRSLALQLADHVRRFSLVLLDDFLSASAREENPSAAHLLQLAHFYPTLRIEFTVGDAGLGYYAFLHAGYALGARRVVDLRADPTDRDKANWPVRGYDDKGRPVCPFGYRFTANGFDSKRRRYKWVCNQACRKGKSPCVELQNVPYPPQECPYRDPARRHGKTVDVGETFGDGSSRLARDVPVGKSAWECLYHRARNAVEGRNATLQAWGLKRLPVYGLPRGRATIALADTWINLTTLARLVREATLATPIQPG